MKEKEFFDRYSFNVQTDNIGGGSFGTVYKAYDNALDREVAIKVSEVKFVGDKEQICILLITKAYLGL